METIEIIDVLTSSVGQSYKTLFTQLGEPTKFSVGWGTNGFSGDIYYTDITVIIRGGLVEGFFYTKN